MEGDVQAGQTLSLSVGQKSANYDLLVPNKIEHLPFEAMAISKMGYKHFMLKEIHEQGDVVRNVLSGKLISPEHKIQLDELLNDNYYFESTNENAKKDDDSTKNNVLTNKNTPTRNKLNKNSTLNFNSNKNKHFKL